MNLENESYLSQNLQHSGHHRNIKLSDFKAQMKKVRFPFEQNINKSKQSFNKKIKQFEKNIIKKDQPQQVQLQQQKSQNVYKNSKLQTEEQLNQKENEQFLNENRQSQTQQHKKNNNKQAIASFMKQWKANNKYSFFNIQDVKQNYISVFNRKLSVKKKVNKKHSYDYKEDQTKMLKNIFQQISDQYGHNKGFAQIQKIIQFFQENQLFYLFYNLHKKHLKHVLRQFAHTRKDSLTQVEFLHLLFMDRPLVKDFSDPEQKVVHRKCILDEQGWEQLKKLFNTLDTFGNQTIHIRPFIKKLKSYHSNRNFLYTPVIQFPQIQRVYTLKKVVFDLEHKFQFDDKVQWKDIQDLIFNFNHKEEPTLDLIFQEHLQQASILLDSNYFLIDKSAISLLKNIFQKCPKYSDFFVNTKFICNQILESHDLKSYFKHPVRQHTRVTNGYINLQEATRYMAAKAPQYIDLDEFLEYYSIKGPVTNIMPQQYNFQIQQSDGQDSEINSSQIKKLRKIRSLERIQKCKINKKCKKPLRQITDFQQFNLTKKQKQTIRQKRLKQQLQQKQKDQLKQLANKFKANPIPADLNPQRLKQQQKRMQMQKRKKLQQIAKQRQEDKQIIGYLKANTKLFQPLIKQNLQQTNQNYFDRIEKKKKTFVHKPVPWFVQENLLSKIQHEKSQRKKKIYQQAKIKYVRSWNKLPDFFFHEQEQQNSAQNSIIQELKKKNQFEIQKVQIKASPVPDFKSLHHEFQASLQKKKKQFTPTKIIQFKLTSPKIQKHAFNSEYFSPKNKVTSDKRWRETLHSPPSNKISTTKKVEDWVKHNQKMMEQKKLKNQLQKQKQKQRLLKQKNFARFMSQKLRSQQKTLPNLEYQTAQKLKNYKKKVQYLQRKTEQQLSQIYARVLQRPFLFEEAVEKKIKSNKKFNQMYKSKKNGIKKVKHIEAIDMSEYGHQNNKKSNQSPKQNQQYSEQMESGRNQVFNQSF